MKSFKNIFLILIFISLVLTVINYKANKFSALEIDKNFTRQEYLGNGLGKIYKNRYGVVFFKDIYPKLVKLESSFFNNFKSPLVYLPIFILLIYLGHKQSLPLRGKKI